MPLDSQNMLPPFRTIPSREKFKDLSVESLRGLACILIVAFHAIGTDQLEDYSSSYGYLAHSFRLIRLPLFVTISGYVYTLHPVAFESFSRFVAGKARRILLPWISVTLLTMVLYATIGRRDFSIATVAVAFWNPIDHLWFLPAIFWIVNVVAILEVIRLLKSIRGWAFAFLLSWVPAIFFMGFHGLAFSGFCQLLPFFLFGLGLARFQVELSMPKMLSIFSVYALSGLVIHQMLWFKLVELDDIHYNILVLVAACGIQGLLFRYRRNIPLLAWLGNFSFAIYLFHLIAISVATRLAASCHVSNIHVVYAVKTSLGLLLPILLAMTIKKSPVLNLVLLGRSYFSAKV